MAGVLELRKDLETMVLAAIEEKEPDNPIYKATESLIMKELATTKGNNIDSFILEKLEEMSGQISRISAPKIKNSIAPSVIQSGSRKVSPIYNTVIHLKNPDYDKFVKVIRNSFKEIPLEFSYSDKDIRLALDLNNDSEAKEASRIFKKEGFEIISAYNY